jgi:hypothetical protein
MREQDQAILHEIVLRGDGFGHRQHIELAWRYLGIHDFDRAADIMGEAVRRLAASHGQPGKYHETVTRAWTRCVAVHQRRWPGGTFAEFLELNPRLLNSALLTHFYSPGLLRTSLARQSYVEPDLRPLPSLAG